MSSVFTTVSRRPASDGVRWVKQGWHFFKAYPQMWVLLTLIQIGVLCLIEYLPVVGVLCSTLLMPVFMGGYMLGCADIEAGKPLELNHLIAGFRSHLRSLLAVGGVYLASEIVIVWLLMIFDGELVKVIMTGQQPIIGAQSLIALLLTLFLFTLLVMASWFAPALVTQHNLSALTAMRISFQACLRNLLPFLVNGLVWLSIGIPLLALLMVIYGNVPKSGFSPALVSLGFLTVLIPLAITNIYASFVVIFQRHKT